MVTIATTATIAAIAVTIAATIAIIAARNHRHCLAYCVHKNSIVTILRTRYILCGERISLSPLLVQISEIGKGETEEHDAFLRFAVRVNVPQTILRSASSPWC